MEASRRDMTLATRRKTTFKAGVNSPAARTKRAEQCSGIRKNKRQENLRKRRQLTLSSAAAPPAPPSAGELEVTVDSLPSIGLSLAHASTERQIEVTRAVRKLLSKPENPPVRQVIDAGLLPTFVAYLSRAGVPRLQFEAAWALTNISSTDETKEVVDHHAVPALVPLLRSPDADVREQAAWCLGNIAGDCEVLRDLVLGTPDALQGLLLNLTHPQSSTSMRRNVVWTVSNLCRGKNPKPNTSLLEPAVPVLVSLLARNVDPETTADACWALSYASDGDDGDIQTVVSQGACGPLVALLAQYAEDAEGHKIVTPALRCLGNIVTGNAEQTQAAVDAGLLKQLARLLEYTNRKGIRKEACWTASNVTAGTKDQVGAFLMAPGLAEQIVYQLSGGEWDVRKEAAFCIGNACTGGTKQHVQCLVERHEAIRPLCDLLTVQDTTIVLQTLQALKAILSHDPDTYATLVDEAGGMEAIEDLQQHDSEKVYALAVKILERFFSADSEDDENLMPNSTEDGNAFMFTAQLPATDKFDFGAFSA